MKRELIHGHGVQGMRVDLSIADMFAANQVADELKAVVENHHRIEQYKTTPYDQRKEAFPEGEPKRIEVSEKTLQNLHQLMLKLSYENKSTLFDEFDECEEDRRAYDVILLNAGPAKINTVKVIKNFAGFSLVESKELVDTAESGRVEIATYSAKTDAQKLVDKLMEVGAIAEIVSHSI